MTADGYLYIFTIIGLFVVFALLFFRTYRKKNQNKMEDAKYRMLDDD